MGICSFIFLEAPPPPLFFKWEFLLSELVPNVSELSPAKSGLRPVFSGICPASSGLCPGSARPGSLLWLSYLRVFSGMRPGISNANCKVQIAKCDLQEERGFWSKCSQEILKIIWNKWNSVGTRRTCVWNGIERRTEPSRPQSRTDCILRFSKSR